MQIGAMHGTMAGQSGQTAEPRLVRAAHQFEAQMMKELLEPMTRKNAILGDGDQPDGGILGEFASESLAGALSTKGGLGIANRIIATLSPHSSQTPTESENSEARPE